MGWGCPGARLWRNLAWLSLLPFSPCLLLRWDLNLVWSWARVLPSRSNWMPMMMLGLFLPSMLPFLGFSPLPLVVFVVSMLSPSRALDRTTLLILLLEALAVGGSQRLSTSVALAPFFFSPGAPCC